MAPGCGWHRVGLQNGSVRAAFYVLAVARPCLTSGYRSIVAFSALEMVGWTLVALAYEVAYASLWRIESSLPPKAWCWCCLDALPGQRRHGAPGQVRMKIERSAPVADRDTNRATARRPSRGRT